MADDLAASIVAASTVAANLDYGNRDFKMICFHDLKYPTLSEDACTSKLQELSSSISTGWKVEKHISIPMIKTLTSWSRRKIDESTEYETCPKCCQQFSPKQSVLRRTCGAGPANPT